MNSILDMPLPVIQRASILILGVFVDNVDSSPRMSPITLVFPAQYRNEGGVSMRLTVSDLLRLLRLLSYSHQR